MLQTHTQTHTRTQRQTTLAGFLSYCGQNYIRCYCCWALFSDIGKAYEPAGPPANPWPLGNLTFWLAGWRAEMTDLVDLMDLTDLMDSANLLANFAGGHDET